jgi:hypothetical protein
MGRERRVVDDDMPRLGEGLEPAPDSEGAADGGFGRRLDRRDMMKKAAIGASAVWVAPKIQGLTRRQAFAASLSHCTGTFHFDAPLSGSVTDSKIDAASPVGVFEHETFQACGPFAVNIRQDYQAGADAFSKMAVNVGWGVDTCAVESLNVDGKHHAINAPVQTGPLNRATYILFSNTASDGTDAGLDARPSGGGKLHLGVTCT